MPSRALLILGFAVRHRRASPRRRASRRSYDSEAGRIRQEMDRRAPTPMPVRRTRAMPIAPPMLPRYCADCPPPKRYDSTEVIKTSRDVDHSRVINTEDAVQVPSQSERDQQTRHPRERNPQCRGDPAQSPDRRERNALCKTRAGPSARRPGIPAFRVSRPCSCPSWCSPCRIAAVPARAPDRTAPTPRLTVYGAGYAYGSGRGHVQ